jgi:hypothetical protein|tara:strand:+ start:23 stop:358 length:336 start_codon:yes stop_codon:yes gene_type:complete
MANEEIFKVIFHNQGKVYELFAKEVYQSDMYGFITIEEITFSERDSVLVDPGEEKLKTEFDAVKRCYIPMHSVIRIDEVEKQGVSKISDVDSKVMQFPGTIYTPGNDTDPS